MKVSIIAVWAGTDTFWCHVNGQCTELEVAPGTDVDDIYAVLGAITSYRLGPFCEFCGESWPTPVFFSPIHFGVKLCAACIERCRG